MVLKQKQGFPDFSESLIFTELRMTGLEPASLAAPEPKSKSAIFCPETFQVKTQQKH
jgi:hypothetical protein